MYNPNIYTVGGTVQAGGGIYISRQADEELLALCRQRIFAYVLTPRQMGKSSLMVRTAERLTEEDIKSVIIDLTQLGVQVTAEQWYLGLLTIIEGTLMLDTDVVQWWQAHAHLGFTQRLTQFFQQVLLAEVASPIVIFVDEIDTTLSLDFTDDFFAAIRSFYNTRSDKPEFRRLSFVLIGVATPGDLIGDSKRTPFNIGQRVDLTDFTFEEAKPLAEGLGLAKDAAQQVLRRVLTWTAGHPYLSQRLCNKLREQGKSNWSEADIERLVSSTFFGTMSEQDNNLQFVRDMLTKRAPDLFDVLSTYGNIRRGKRAIVDEEQSLVKSHLKLSGVVRRENTCLRIRNLIYWKVFDNKWVKENLSVYSTKAQQLQQQRRLRQAQRAVVAVWFLGTIVAFILGNLAYWQGREAQLREIVTLNSLSGANFLSFQQIDVLIVSVKAGKQLKQIIGAPTDVQFQTVRSLGHALSNTQELNRLEKHSKAVLSVKFSPDG
ncbi:AAA-like domain-containing protein, partial [Tolypothrix sp. NIES-4075]|uniref:AAA-like domain-containing protein n=1 Tax=Tolypothrix sp. NIES-4075 TaxID=2005459 RepID=UPI00190EB98A